MNIAQTIFDNQIKYPDSPAINYQVNGIWKQYSWTEFINLVSQTANALLESNVKPNDNVAIYAENMAEWIIFDLAVMSIGAVGVPIYATSTALQAKYILDEAEVKVILVGGQKQYDNVLEIYIDSDFLETIIIAKDNVRPLTENSYVFSEWIKNQPTKISVVEKKEDDLITLIYTSGTTGEPKGVMLTHGNFYQLFESHIEFFNLKDCTKEHSLAFLPLSHVFERCWSLFMLTVGAQVYFLQDPKTISSALKEVRPTMMCSVPRLYQKVYSAIMQKINEGPAIKARLFKWAVNVGHKVSELKRQGLPVSSRLKLQQNIADRLVFSKIKAQLGGRLWFMPVGGASLTADISAFFDAIGIHLLIGYGLTETSATVTCFPFTGYAHGTAGKPMHGVQVKIGDNNEILVKGKSVMKGYYKKPEATREVFTEDGWFRTGDAGVFDENGNLKIIDRIKDLMKTSNGKYITPQPIENLMTNDNFIQQIVLIGDNRPYVTALIVPNFEALDEHANKNQIEFTSHQELVANPVILNFYEERIKNNQRHLAEFEKIKKFHLMPKDFEMETGEITPTLKVKRKVVMDKFVEDIEEMYRK